MYGWSKTAGRIHHELYGHYYKYSAQNFSMAGLPVWFLQPLAAWDSPVRCNVLLLSNLTVSYVFQKTTHPSLQFFMALQLIQKDMVHSMLIHESGWCSKTHLGVQRVSQSNFSLTYLLTTFKGSTTLIISVSSSKSALSSQSSSIIQSVDHHKMFCPEHSQASAQGAPCTFAPLFLCSIFSHTLFKTQSPKLHKPVIATNSHNIVTAPH